MGQSPPTPRTQHVATFVVFSPSIFLQRVLAFLFSFFSFFSSFFSSFPFHRLAILQFHVLPYGNIVIFLPRRAFLRAAARAPLISAHLDSRPARPRIRDHAGIAVVRIDVSGIWAVTAAF